MSVSLNIYIYIYIYIYIHTYEGHSHDKVDNFFFYEMWNWFCAQKNSNIVKIFVLKEIKQNKVYQT